MTVLSILRANTNLVLDGVSGAYSAVLARPALSITISLNLLGYVIYRYVNSPWRKLPPGPTGYPILGSALKLLDASWLFNECSKHGDVVYLNVAGQPTLILNTQKAAADLLERRAAAYSGRPRFIVGHELMCGGLFFAFEPHNDRWRRQRRVVHEGFNKSAASRFRDAEAQDAVRLAEALIKDPSAFRPLYHTYACSIVLSVTYDRPIRGSPEDEALRARIDDFVKRDQAALRVGAHYVELLPWMVHLPNWMARWKRDALEMYKDTTEFFMGLVDDVETRMNQGTARPCLTTTLVEESERFHVSRLEAAWSAGVMYAAGSETTSNMLDWWTLAMVAFPDVQKRAQAELDSVVGRGRLPSFTDRALLPYTVAVLREVLRWRTGIPFGLPHQADEDGWYEGMFIPKGSIIMANILPCNRDPAVYGDDAEAFKPERHLDEQGQLKAAPPATKDHGHVSFGFGRRICVGQHVAEDALFIATATLLWTLEFKKVLDEHGQEIEVDYEGYESSGLTMRANHFECRITPRFSDVHAFLAEEKELQAS
ncbi:cytochrome P450 [Peniophora sp. CONT]|nr:cytochrome P450 [Peniophora sp. CONT]